MLSFNLLQFIAAAVLSLNQLLFVSASAPSGAFTLYAYGTNISGLPVIYGDSQAYVGSDTTGDLTSTTNVTFTLNDTSLYAYGDDSTALETTALFAINASTTAHKPAEFLTNDTDMTTTGFFFYGKQVFWRSTDDTLQSYFWATQVETDLWKLMWNGDDSDLTDSVPVGLKYAAPSN